MSQPPDIVVRAAEPSDIADRWWNIRRLEPNVYADNARAIALYERFGFQSEGLLRDYAWRDGAYVDSLAMARVRP